MKRLSFLFVFIQIFMFGCSVVKQDIVTLQPMTVDEIKFTDLQSATSKSINALLAADVIKEKKYSKPFVLIGNIDNKFIPHVNADFISQDIRLAILMSDKAVTMPESIKNNADEKDKTKKPETNDALPVFDYFLSGEIIKDKIQTPEGDKECFSLCFKLKDLKTKLVIWEEDTKLLK
jgi:PBP1b-binding outer membrane lipoprotein LpoB